MSTAQGIPRTEPADPAAGSGDRSAAGALDLDAPVTLDELLDRNARETLRLGAEDLGVRLAVADRDGTLVLGQAPRAVLETTVDLDPIEVDAEGSRWEVGPLYHQGDLVGVIAVGPTAEQGRTGAQVGAHLRRVCEAFMHDGMKRALSARMHMATVEQSNRELTEKNKWLGQMVERLQEADRVKSNFLATVSHELRTPLTSVIGYSEMLLEGIAGELNEEQREYVGTVMEKGDQLLQLITGILEISRIEAGKLRVARAPLDLPELASVALSTVAPHARRKKITVSAELAPDLPPALGDRDKVRQVLLNLLNNAIKFTPEGGKVILGAALGPLHPPGATETSAPWGLNLWVRDSGIGIPAEHHLRVFEPFYQVDSSSTREFGGTGLGLSIVKRFIEAQGGTVWVESEPGRGATFFFSLPLPPPPSTG